MYRRASPDLGDRPSVITRGDNGRAPSRAAPTTPLVPKELVSPTQPPSTSDAGSPRSRRHHTAGTRWPRGWVVDGPQTSLLYRSEYRAIKDGSRLVLHQAVRMCMCLGQVTAQVKEENDTTAPPVKRHAWFVVGILHLVRSVFPFQSVSQSVISSPFTSTLLALFTESTISGSRPYSSSSKKTLLVPRARSASICSSSLSISIISIIS